MTTVSKEVKIEFDGMSEKKSTDYQLSEWVKGRSLHNPITDICCPDFSCCTGEIMNEEKLELNEIKIKLKLN